MSNQTDSCADNLGFGLQLASSYAALPPVLFASATPSKVPSPKMVILNERLALEMGIDPKGISGDSGAALFAGQALASGSEPIAQAYAGHQFGSFTMLGDGRAILLGEFRSPSGALVDIQLKGAGRTQFSRGGDGRAALGPMLREYLISEAMFALGIPTTRSLAVVTTGEPVYRDSVKQGAILTRVAASHIRVGTFEYLAARKDLSSLRSLADYCIDRHYPGLVHASDKYLAFFRAVMDRQASLIAKWQLVGFIHGVMNTDNMAISGETIDYGPCAFMNAYSPETVFSSIDYHGRYAYGNQPAIAHWNLARFAEALLGLLHDDKGEAVTLASEGLSQFPATFERYWLEGMRKKLGLETAKDNDMELITSLLQWMESARSDFTNTFRDLSRPHFPTDAQYLNAEFRSWYARWQTRLTMENRPEATVRRAMQAVNPAVIPRNHLVEEALAAAEHRNDLSVLHQLLNVLASPYDHQTEVGRYQIPSPDDGSYRTFCGT